jgi:hypothetical protein
MDFDSFRPTAPGVLAFARALKGDLSVVLLNFNAEPVETGLVLRDPGPAGVRKGEVRTVRDLLADVAGEAAGRMASQPVRMRPGAILQLKIAAHNGVVLRFER